MILCRGGWRSPANGSGWSATALPAYPDNCASMIGNVEKNQVARTSVLTTDGLARTIPLFSTACSGR